MTKVLRIFALLMAASMLLWIAGCGGDDDDDDECVDNVAPTATVAPNGGSVSLNSTITLTFSKTVEAPTATLGGDAVTLAGTGKSYTFTPTKEGNGQALTVTAEDACGDAASFAGASFDVAAADEVDPALDGAASSPKDGETGVDPAGITEIVVKFSEALDADASQVTSILPEDLGTTTDTAFADDTLTITFLGGATLGNEEDIVVEIDIVDLAGNTASVSYTFTTMAKEE